LPLTLINGIIQWGKNLKDPNSNGCLGNFNREVIKCQRLSKIRRKRLFGSVRRVKPSIMTSLCTFLGEEKEKRVSLTINEHIEHWLAESHHHRHHGDNRE
jgi:hypothetical protein